MLQSYQLQCALPSLHDCRDNNATRIIAYDVPPEKLATNSKLRTRLLEWIRETYLYLRPMSLSSEAFWEVSQVCLGFDAASCDRSSLRAATSVCQQQLGVGCRNLRHQCFAGPPLRGPSDVQRSFTLAHSLIANLRGRVHGWIRCVAASKPTEWPD